MSLKSQSLGYPVAPQRAPRDEEIAIAGCKTFTVHSGDEVKVPYSFYTKSSEVLPQIEEVRSCLEVASSASDGTAEWPPAKSAWSPSDFSRAREEMPEILFPSKLNEPQQTASEQGGRGHSANPDLGHHPAVAVLRHGERQDSVFGSTWHGTEDFKRYPFDCPISDHAVLEAQQAAHKLRGFAEFDIIVSSPYLRCVQTAIALADALDVMVLLDYELGEVFGPPVFGELGPIQTGRAWRSRQELHAALQHWSPELLHGFSKLPVERVHWEKVMGRPPTWGEKLTDAHQRYAKRFLTYLSRGRRSGKKMILVSHGVMVQTCLKILPSTSALSVASIPFCGGLMAGLRRFSIQQVVAETTNNTHSVNLMEVNLQSHEPAEKWPERNSPRKSASRPVEEAQLHTWDVQVIDVRFATPSACTAASAKHHQDLFARLNAGSFSWAQLQLLLGQLPTELPPQAFQRTGAAELSDSASQVSMEFFKCPSQGWTRQDSVEQQTAAVMEANVPQLSLKGSRLLGRRLSQ